MANYLFVTFLEGWHNIMQIKVGPLFEECSMSLKKTILLVICLGLCNAALIGAGNPAEALPTVLTVAFQGTFTVTINGAASQQQPSYQQGRWDNSQPSNAYPAVSERRSHSIPVAQPARTVYPIYPSVPVAGRGDRVMTPGQQTIIQAAAAREAMRQAEEGEQRQRDAEAKKKVEQRQQAELANLAQQQFTQQEQDGRDNPRGQNENGEEEGQPVVHAEAHTFLLPPVAPMPAPGGDDGFKEMPIIGPQGRQATSLLA